LNIVPGMIGELCGVLFIECDTFGGLPIIAANFPEILGWNGINMEPCIPIDERLV